MNATTHPSPAGADPQREARLAARMAAVLTRGLDDIPADVESRLRFAREQALARHAVAARPAASAAHAGGGTAVLGSLGGPGGRWGLRLGMLLPLAAVVAGLLLVQAQRQRQAVAVAAQIDSKLLADELPPEAYADPGFVAFLKLQQP